MQNAVISRRLACLALVVVTVGCANPDMSSRLQSQTQSFVHARDQAVAVVQAAKHDAGPESINDVNIKYAALQAQANNYLGLVVEAINTGSLDEGKSQEDAVALRKAIAGFNGSVEPVVNPKSVALTPGAMPVQLPLPDQWVDSFNTSLDGSWSDYQKTLSSMSAQQRTSLGEELKSELAWPNFENIASESLPARASNGQP